MREYSQVGYSPDFDIETKAFAPESKAAKKLIAKPRKKPDVAATRKKVFARYSKTLAYLAK